MNDTSEAGPPQQPRRATGRRKPAVHGTQGGYNSHRYHGEEACPECKAAHNEYTQRLRREEIAARRHPAVVDAYLRALAEIRGRKA